MKARQKLMSLLGVTLLLASTILTPISTVVAQTQNSTQTSQTTSGSKEVSKEQAQQSSSTTNTGDKSKQSPKGAESSKSNKTEEKSETQPGAPPRSKRTRRAAPAGALDVKEVNDVITKMYVTDSNGKPFQNGKGVEMWQGFQVHAKFKLTDNTISEGDTTTIKLPDTLRFPNAQDFEVKDSKNNVVARAKINAATKTITLTYTNYPSQHSDVSGELFFYAAVDHGKVTQETDLDLEFKVGHKTLAGGKLHYQGPAKKTETIIEKSAWQDEKDKSLFHFVVAVNRKGDNLTDVKVKDRLDDSTYGVQIVSGSVKILQVEWYWENGEWKHRGDKDVTDRYPVTMDADNRGFEISLGNIGTKGYLIKYQVRANYVPTDGETFVNRAKLFDKGKLLKEASAWLIYQGAGGKAEGYVYSMNLHKEDERTHTPLAGAKFRVTRVRNGKVIGEYETNANGEITIDKLLKDEYTIEEIKAPDGYKKSDEKIKVTPDDFGSDKVYRKKITNKKDEKVSAKLQVKKELIGRQLKNKEFTFELKKDGEQNPIQTKSNDADGKVTFDALEFTEEGTYNYTISEKREDHPEKGIYYDPNDIQVTVKVSRNQEGKLATEVTYQGKGANGQLEKKDTFTNHYIPDKTSTKLSVTKKLIGRQLKDKEFEFELKKEGDQTPIQTKPNDANGKVQFDSIEYDKAGTYNYIISEKAGNVPGVVYEPNLISATVVVEDKGGKLEVTKVTYSKAGLETNDPTFNNVYTPDKTSATFDVTKELTGRKLKAQEFEFELKEDGKSGVLQTAKNDAQGKVQFQAINYDKAGDYHYTITEKNNGLTGVAYDSSEVKVTVKVTDDGKGKLSTTVTYDGGKKTFKNTFTPKEITVPLQVTKALTGRNLQDDEFEFELYDGKDNSLLQTAKNKADGTIPFTALKFTKAGLYNYLIKEKDGNVPGVDYDKQPIKVTVHVQQEEDGQLVVNVIYLGLDESGKNKISKQSFTNKYTAKGTDATFSVTKKLTGRSLKDGEFSFELKEDGKTDVLQTKKNEKDGKVQFDAIKYSAVGTHHYTITEKNTGLGGVTYDTKTIKVTVEVTDDVSLFQK